MNPDGTIPASPYDSLQNAADHILKQLKTHFEFTTWVVIYLKKRRWVILCVDDPNYGWQKGHEFKNTDCYFKILCSGKGPNYAANVNEIKVYKDAKLNAYEKITSFLGIPLLGSQGKVFGAICAFDPKRREISLEQDLDFLKINACMLSSLFDKEYQIKHNDRLMESLENNLKYDQLTGLYNRRGFIQRALAEESVRAYRYNQNMGFILIKLNLDINEGIKTDFAEEFNVLKKTADELTNTVRPYDICARVNQFEFSVLLIDLTSQTLELLVNRIRTRLVDGGISAKIGYALKNPDDNFSEVVEMASNMSAAPNIQIINTFDPVKG